MQKLIIGITVLVIVVIGGAIFMRGGGSEDVSSNSQAATPSLAIEGASVVSSGTYVINGEKSTIGWSAKKPLIDGYVNSGSFRIKEGAIDVKEKVSGKITLDMNKLSVGLTATKPGKEGALETHLKSKDFFDVTKFPTATFVIKEVIPQADSATSFSYTVKGTLTMKDKTNDISFPAIIYEKDGAVNIEATTEIDRTLWGITYGSGNFFKDLADNVIDDMVKLSLNISATKDDSTTVSGTTTPKN